MYVTNDVVLPPTPSVYTPFTTNEGVYSYYHGVYSRAQSFARANFTVHSRSPEPFSTTNPVVDDQGFSYGHLVVVPGLTPTGGLGCFFSFWCVLCYRLHHGFVRRRRYRRRRRFRRRRRALENLSPAPGRGPSAQYQFDHGDDVDPSKDDGITST